MKWTGATLRLNKYNHLNPISGNSGHSGGEMSTETDHENRKKILDESINNGEFHPVDLRITNNLLYSQLETLSFRMIVRGKKTL